MFQHQSFMGIDLCDQLNGTTGLLDLALGFS
jgi:hypothetical protein